MDDDTKWFVAYLTLSALITMMPSVLTVIALAGGEHPSFDRQLIQSSIVQAILIVAIMSDVHARKEMQHVRPTDSTIET